MSPPGSYSLRDQPVFTHSPAVLDCVSTIKERVVAAPIAAHVVPADVHMPVCRADGGHIDEAGREAWTERLLRLLCSEAPAGAAADAEETLRHAAGTALAALASAPGAAGLHVAHAWLGELLIYLSRAVRPYEAVQVRSACVLNNMPGFGSVTRQHVIQRSGWALSVLQILL